MVSSHAINSAKYLLLLHLQTMIDELFIHTAFFGSLLCPNLFIFLTKCQEHAHSDAPSASRLMPREV